MVKSKIKHVALITGANAGIGRALAEALGEDGYLVLVNYRSSERDAQKVADRIHKDGGAAEIVQADVTDPEDLDRLFSNVKANYGRLDVLINNVGNFLRKPFSRLTPHDVREMTESNYFSVVECSLRAAKLMRKQRSGRIINLGYVIAERFQAFPSVAAYFCAKQAMITFSLSLAKNLGKHRVTVNVVSPGININSVEQPEKPSTIIPLGRLGRHDDIINAVRFLLKPESEYTTGTHIKVSGGYGL